MTLLHFPSILFLGLHTQRAHFASYIDRGGGVAALMGFDRHRRTLALFGKNLDSRDFSLCIAPSFYAGGISGKISKRPKLHPRHDKSSETSYFRISNKSA